METIYVVLIIAGLVIILLMAIAYLLTSIKKKKKLKTDIPEDVLMNFNLAEDIMKESGGTASPHQILWDIYKYNKEKSSPTKQIDVPQPIQKPIDKPKPDWRRFMRK